MFRGLPLPPMMRSLSARLLVLTMFFVMVSEIAIFVPSVARFRMTYFEDRIASGHLAVLALEAAPGNEIGQPLADQLLSHVGALGVVLHKRGDLALMIGSEMPPTIDTTFDLVQSSMLASIREALVTLLGSKDRVLRVLGPSPKDPQAIVEVVLYEAPLRQEMWDFGTRVLELSILISLTTAALVFLSLQWLIVRPMSRITAAMMEFRADPEDPGRIIVPSRRNDEVGLAERELAIMQETVHQALRQRARLAALGTAVTKINHDLRGILSTARLLSDSLAESLVPEVRRVAPTLLAAIDRAVALCTRTLDFTREEAPPLIRRRFALAALVEDVAEALDLAKGGEPAHGEARRLRNEVAPALEVEADRDQLYRVLFNLARNAFEAGAQRVEVAASQAQGQIWIDVADDGPGLPPKARDNLFQPFTGSARRGGTGLGLAIARELMRSHGGDILLVESAAMGTVFRLVLPARPLARAGPRGARQPAVAAPQKGASRSG